MRGIIQHEALTLRFIEEDPITLVFRRVSRIANDSGGFQPGVEADLAPQQVRVVSQKQFTQKMDSEADSIARVKVVIGMPDLDIERKDQFTYNGVDYEVTKPIDGPGWAVRMEAKERV